jgi:hypothetical protein
LDRQVEKDLLSTEFRAKLDFERAIVLIQSAKLIGNGDERGKQFAVAQQLLEKFAQGSENAELKILANNELGNLLFQRANLILFEASQDENKTVRDDMLGQARTLLQRAREIYVVGRTQLKTELEAIPKILDPKTQQPQIERRKSLYGNYLQVMITAVQFVVVAFWDPKSSVSLLIPFSVAFDPPHRSHELVATAFELGLTCHHEPSCSRLDSLRTR